MPWPGEIAGLGGDLYTGKHVGDRLFREIPPGKHQERSPAQREVSCSGSPLLRVLYNKGCPPKNLAVVARLFQLADMGAWHISLMAKDVEHFLRRFSAIPYSSFGNVLFSFLFHFLIRLFDSLVSSCLSSLYTLVIRHLSVMELVKIFSYPVGCCFVFLTVSLALQKIFSLIKSHLSIFVLRAGDWCSVQEIFSCAYEF